MTSAGWWFQIFFMFIPTWGRFPFWPIFFKGVETTNQSIGIYPFFSYGPGDLLLSVGTDHFVPRRFSCPFKGGMSHMKRGSMEKFHYLHP